MATCAWTRPCQGPGLSPCWEEAGPTARSSAGLSLTGLSLSSAAPMRADPAQWFPARQSSGEGQGARKLRGCVATVGPGVLREAGAPCQGHAQRQMPLQVQGSLSSNFPSFC